MRAYNAPPARSMGAAATRAGQLCFHLEIQNAWLLVNSMLGLLQPMRLLRESYEQSPAQLSVRSAQVVHDQPELGREGAKEGEAAAAPAAAEAASARRRHRYRQRRRCRLRDRRHGESERRPRQAVPPLAAGEHIALLACRQARPTSHGGCDTERSLLHLHSWEVTGELVA